MASQLGLGRLFDISCGIAVVDLATGANTGSRASLKNADAVTIVIHKEVGTDSEPVVATLKEHTAATSGSSANLAVITDIYKKSEATLDGDETWTKVTQAAGATFTEAAADDTLQAIYCITVSADQLSDGFDYVSLDIADTGTTAGTLGTVLYILHDLKVKRAPANMPAPLS